MNGLISDLKCTLQTANKKNPSIPFKLSQLRRLLPYLKAHSGKAFGGSFLMLLVSLLTLPIPYLTKFLIDEVFQTRDFSLLGAVVLRMAALHLAKLVLSFVMNYLFTILSQEILVSIRRDLFHKVIRLPLSFFDRNQTGYVVSRLAEVRSLSAFFSPSIVRLFTSLLEFVFSLGILFYLHWKLTLLALLTVPAYFFATKYFSTGLRASSVDMMEKAAHLSKNVQESLSGIRVIKAHASEDWERAKIEGSLKTYLRSSVVQSIFLSLSSEVIFFTGALGGIAVLWYSGAEIMRGDFTVGSYFAFAGYLAKLYGPTQMVASVGLTLQPAVSALNRVAELFDLVDEDGDQNRTVRVTRLRGEVCFEDVSFSYDGARDVLSNVSFQIYPGEKVAFVGPCGAGKSTIVQLLLGLYQGFRGRIVIDGNDINTLILSTLRERVGLVSQRIFLFNDTILNNIRYSKPDATRSQVMRAARVAGAHEFICALPAGYDTVVGERGAVLSGGQMQMVAIARALLRDPDVLIFDEATSQLDNETERVVARAIDQLFRKKTRIIIAHRSLNVVSADRIFVVQNGRIVQIGRHDDLMKRQGLYRRLYTDIGDSPSAEEEGSCASRDSVLVR